MKIKYDQQAENRKEPYFIEVARKMREDINQKTPELTRDFVSGTYQFATKFVKMFSGMAIAPYVLTSAFNNPNFIVRRESNQVIDNAGAFLGYGLGFLAGAGVDILQTLIWISLPHMYNHDELLAIPLATNCASGVYEWYRHTKERIKEENPSRQNLNDKLRKGEPHETP